MYKPILTTAAFVIGLVSVGIVSTTVVQAETKEDGVLVHQGPGLMPAPTKDVATFKDVTEDMWAYEDIMYLSSENIIKGYGDGRYGPKGNVTRGQVAALIHRYLSTKGDVQVATKNPYKDVKGNMYADAILTVSELGIMGGFPDGTFKPNGLLTRAEMASVMTTIFGLKGDDGFKAEKNSYDFWDMDNKHWANDTVRALYANGLTFGDGNNNFNPEGKVTREQYASFLNRGIHLNKDFVPEPIPVKPVPKPEEEPVVKPTLPIITPTPEPEVPSKNPEPVPVKQHEQTAIDTVYLHSPKRGKGLSFGTISYTLSELNSAQGRTWVQGTLDNLNVVEGMGETITIEQMRINTNGIYSDSYIDFKKAQSPYGDCASFLFFV